MELTSFSIEQALAVLGKRLEDGGLQYELVAINGASLVLLGQIDRSTKDIDLVALKRGDKLISPVPLPQELLEAIDDVSIALDLGKEWINTGPASLLDLGLPKGFEKRLIAREYDALTLHCASRWDQICFKLYAAVDQGPNSKHYTDLKWLEPTYEEIDHARKWCLTQDGSIPFSQEITQVIEALRLDGKAS